MLPVFDEADQTLVYKPNGTAAPAGEFVATSLKVLFNISGTKVSHGKNDQF